MTAVTATVDVGTWRTGDVGGTTGTIVGTPEPSTWAMMLLGFAGLGFGHSDRRHLRIGEGDLWDRVVVAGCGIALAVERLPLRPGREDIPGDARLVLAHVGQHRPA